MALDIIEEFVNLSNLHQPQEVQSKENCEKLITNAVCHNTSSSGLSTSVDTYVRQHQKLCKVSTGLCEQNSELSTPTNSSSYHGPVERDASPLVSTMEKLVESAHFGKLGEYMI